MPTRLLLAVALLLPTGLRAQDETAPEPAPEPEAPSGPSQVVEEVKPSDLPRTPYRVLLSSAFAASPYLGGRLRAEFPKRLSDEADRTFGNAWELDSAANDWLQPATPTALARLTADDALSRFGTGYDRIGLTLVEFAHGRYRVQTRWWNEGSRKWEEVQSASTFDPARVASTAAKLLRDSFLPTVELKSSDGAVFEAIVQGADLGTGDPDFALLAPGQVLTPFFRYLDKENVVQKIQTIPLTFLIVDEITEGVATGRQVSGLRVALSGRRRRVSTRAEVRPIQYEATKMSFVGQLNPDRAISGYDIRIHYKHSTRVKPEEDPILMVSDRSGSVTIPVHPTEPVAWAYVHSASALVARIPYVPGMTKEVTVEVPNDEARLAAEGKLKILESELVDAVAQRQILILRARKTADTADSKAQWDKVDDYLDQLDKQLRKKGRQEFLGRLQSIREAALDEVRGQIIIERRIRALCEKTEGLIDKHLDETTINSLRSEIQDLRSTQ